MPKWNSILDAICIQYPYTQQDILFAFEACGESYDLLLLALDKSLETNGYLIEIARRLRRIK